MLGSDRSLEFHAKFGRYYKSRIPRHGRDLTFHSRTADLYIAAASNEVYRLNLEEVSCRVLYTSFSILTVGSG